MKAVFLLIGLCVCGLLMAQDIPLDSQKRIFFPAPMDRPSQLSIGVTATTLNQDITEEAHFRLPAIDVHLLRRLSPRLYLDARAEIQVLQNMVSVGPHWATRLSHRLYLGLGNDLSYWFGRINIAGIRTRGHGLQNSPNLSLGYRFNKRILLTVRGEALMNFGVQTFAAETEVKSNYRFFSGSAYSVFLEQPFAGSKSMTLGFRGLYTDYLWKTWTLFENYDRKLFFPQLFVGLIL